MTNDAVEVLQDVRDVFGPGSPRLLILSSLAASESRVMEQWEIVELTGLARSTVYNHVNQLVEYGMVQQSHIQGSRSIYSLNEDHPCSAAIKTLTKASPLTEYEPPTTRRFP